MRDLKISLSVAAVLGLGFLFFSIERPYSRAFADGNSAAVAKVETADSDQAMVLIKRPRAKEMSSTAVALPPSEALVADTYVDLKRRADSGEVAAACRLAVDLMGCRQAIDLTDRVSPSAWRESEERFVKRGNVWAADQWANIQIGLAIASARCKGVTKDQLAETTKYLRQAALGGNVEAGIRYANGESFGAYSGLSLLQDPQFETWRREALPLMVQAASRGSVEAVFLLATAYSVDTSDTDPFMAIVKNDPYLTRVYSSLYHRIRGQPAASDEYSKSTAGQRAETAAAAMHKDHFKGAVIPDTPDQSTRFGPQWGNINDEGQLIEVCRE